MEVTSLGSLSFMFASLKQRGGVCVLAPSIRFILAPLTLNGSYDAT